LVCKRAADLLDRGGEAGNCAGGFTLEVLGVSEEGNEGEKNGNGELHCAGCAGRGDAGYGIPFVVVRLEGGEEQLVDRVID
jgi:hypothetical protein